MKQQLKKGIIEVFVLALLLKEDSYGYRLVTDLKSYLDISESTLYPILRRLEAQNKLSVYNEIIEGRNRKYYKVSPLGKKQVKEFIIEWEKVKDIYDLLTGVEL